MFNKLKNIELKKNKEILLIVFLTVVLFAIFATPRFLGMDKVTRGTEQTKISEEVASETNEVDSKSNQSEKDSKSNRENTSNNLNSYHKETTETDFVKGTTKKSSVKPKANTQKPEEPESQIVVLEINTGTNFYSYNVSWQEDMNVYDVLASASEKNKFSLVAKWYGTPLNSYYITEVYGYNCQCWTYKLKDKNDNEVPGSGLGASLDTVDPGNIIIWKAT